ncbi:MAG: S66 peptidase family protein [Pseudomonadota bacterium]
MNYLEQLIKPEKLKIGDKVAAISLSWGGAGTYPYRYEIGKSRLESIFGLQVYPTKHALRSEEWISNNPKARADDLIEAFLDPSIKAIITNIGGDDSIRLLPFVDLEIIKNNPKIFLGFSDSTATHFQCLKAGLRSFYGPSLMTAFAENVKMHEYSILGIKKTLFSNQVIGAIPENNEGWTKELLDWEDSGNQNILKQLEAPTEWKFIGNKSKISTGRLIGGCLEVLQMINGTDIWPELSVWSQSILFIETSEEGVGADFVLRFMRNLAAQGILAQLKAILFSKPGGEKITLEYFSAYDQAILAIFKEYDLPLIPIVTNMDFGHSDPMWTLPYGALIEVNPILQTLTILESGVK